MAARRLIAILLVLLFLSSLAAALAPVQRGIESTSTTGTQTTTAEAEPAPPEAGGTEPRRITQSVDASAKRLAVIRARPGDQLELRVTSRKSGTIELARIGPTEDVGPRQPALFDVLLRTEVVYPIRFLETRRTIAEIRVVGRGRRPPGPS